MTVFAGQAAAGHGEGGGAGVSVAGHGLVDHNGVQEGGVAVALGVVGGEVAVRQSDGVHALNAYTLGKVGHQRRIGYGDGCRGINSRGAEAVGGVGAAVYVYRAAAAVGADGGRGAAGGGDGQGGGVGNAAAGGHDAAGAVAGGGDNGIGDVHGGAVARSTVLTAVSAIRKDAVGTAGVAGDGSAHDVHFSAALCQHRCVQTVEVAAVAAVGIPGFGNGGICQGDSLIRINEDRIFIRAVR